MFKRTVGDSKLLRCEMTSSGVKECALCASSAHNVHHASVCVNVVIGVLVVLGEVRVARLFRLLLML